MFPWQSNKQSQIYLKLLAYITEKHPSFNKKIQCISLSLFFFYRIFPFVLLHLATTWSQRYFSGLYCACPQHRTDDRKSIESYNKCYTLYVSIYTLIHSYYIYYIEYNYYHDIPMGVFIDLEKIFSLPLSNRKNM